MSNNNYFTVAYKILSYLKYCYEHGIDPDLNFFRADTFEISQTQFFNTLRMLKDDGYVNGIKTRATTTGTVMIGLSNIRVTSKGLQYLEENSMMKKAYNTLKEIRDWAPFI